MIKRLTLPLVTLLLFYSESLFVIFFLKIESFEGRIIVPHFLIIFILFICVFFQYRTALLYAFIFGFLFDIFYTEINGIYLVFYPFVVFLAHAMLKILHNNLFVFSLIVIINLSVLEFLVYQINVIIQRTDMTFIQFADLRLWPTLALNAVFYIIFSYPFKVFLQRKQKQLLED
ncbi:rod shape-determining protein MreD [Bacillus haikouensis]|jgi:rod shape-determining protein MreD|uniref:rod shape-determining protein MreD n=1 Tax=Bacillus haikouensis TaxID=1510468 RepID=UPI001551778B|nr:rod shape-determining protein MreD [Bacillus haikouensis]NQD68173.1 rod shape-determining protein MreD [Bacillus haikouensis]